MADEQAGSQFDLAASPSHLLHRAQQAAVNLSSEALSAQGLTLRQFAVLAALAEEEGQSQASLVDKTGIDRSTLADMVRRMEASGHIKRVVSPEDARAKAVSLMPAGKEAYLAALSGVEAADRELLSVVRANRRAGFLASLTSIGNPADDLEIDDAENADEAGSTDPKPKKKKDKGDKSSKPKSDKKKKKKKKK